MRTIIITSIMMFVFGSVFGQNIRETIVEIPFENRETLNKISRMVSIDNVNEKVITAYASQKQLDYLKAKGIAFKPVQKEKDPSKVINMATTVAQMADWDRYPTYEVYVEMMEQFASDYPNICKLETIGTSVEGRLLLAVKISDNVDSDDEPEPEVFYTATMHGDETTGFVLHLRLIDYLLSNYGTDPEVTEIVNSIELWVNPAANPDGTYAGGNNTVANSTRYNANGVDINRNFPDPEDGQHPDGNSWQVETVAMMDFADLHSFILSQNTHGGTEVVNYPWDTWERRHADDDWWQRVSHCYADTAQELSPSDYFNEYNDGITNGYDWYTISGGRQDYMNYFKHCREFVLEISDVKLLSSDELQDHWTWNKQSLLNYMKEAMYGIQGKVTNPDGEPLAAEIRVNGHELDNSWVVTDPDNGDFYRMIESGSYDLTISANGYTPQVLEHVTITNGNSVWYDVVLSPSGTTTLTGIVTDAMTDQPINNATISIPEYSSETYTTNFIGEFEIANIPEDTYEIIISKDGYGQYIDELLIDADNNQLQISLSQVNAFTFENGSIPEEFSTSGNTNWFATNNEAYEGSYSLQSGDIDDDQNSTLSFTHTFESAGTISFAVKVSSESDYDFLTFSINGSEEESWAGEVDWTFVTYNVNSGTNTFEWKYEKDGSVSNGSDCGWIDFVALPLSSANQAMAKLSDYSFVINATETVQVFDETIEISNIGNSTLTYTSTMQSGEWCTITSSPEDLANGEFAEINFTVDASELQPGTYTDTLVVSADREIKVPIVLKNQVVGVADAESANLSIYPNPVKDMLNITSDQNISRINVYNLTGQKEASVQFGPNTKDASIWLDMLSKGVYVIAIEMENKTHIEKIVIE